VGEATIFLPLFAHDFRSPTPRLRLSPSFRWFKTARHQSLILGSHSGTLNMLNIMLGIRLEPELEEKLESLAKETGRSKSYYARAAIRQFLEDREDYLKGIAALERREPTITLEELERRLGLDQ
jgi:RHH-type transcriptional regulator, rel operon repressor / antitoxin RelB